MFYYTDEDRFGHDFLGEVRIALKKIRPHETRRIRASLDKKTVVS